MRSFALLLALGCFTAPLRAEGATFSAAASVENGATLAPRWRISSLAPGLGLEDRGIFFIDFSADGTAWIAASSGLVRHDGYDHRRFTRADGLPSSYVRCARVSRSGAVWVGTDRGVAVIEGDIVHPFGSLDRLAGPSVRRIVEDPDGTLWFCCDRWPRRTVTAGLSRLRRGEWTTFTTDDGLPSDYVMDYFADSRGRRFVLTLRGLAEIEDDDRVALPLEGSGLEGTDARFWSMVEVPDVGVVAATDSALFILDGDRGWRRVAGPFAEVPQPKLLATRRGEILTFANDPISAFVSWNDGRFETVSERLELAPKGIQSVAESPDGSVWAGGYGFLVRWNRSESGYRLHRGLPPPRFRDGFGGVWMGAAGKRVCRVRDGEWTWFPRVTAEPVLDREDGVWLAHEGAIKRVRGGEIAEWPSRAVGVAAVTLVAPDATDGVYVVGQDAEGRAAAASLRRGLWRRIPLDVADGERAVGGADDPVGGAWVVLQRDVDGTMTHRVVRLDGRRARPISIPREASIIATPFLHADRRSRLWMYGFFGLFLLEPGADRWASVAEIRGDDVSYAAERRGELWFSYRSLTGGDAGLSCLGESGWRHLPLSTVRFAGTLADGSLCYARANGLLEIPAGEDSRPRLRTLPLTGRVLSIVEGADEDERWIGLEDTDFVLRYRPDGHAPETRLLSAPSMPMEGEDLVVGIGGVERFHPPTSRRGFEVETRLDGGPWQRRPLERGELRLGGLVAGTHDLEVRVIDEDGDVDETPLALRTRVVPIPMQLQWWFTPLALSIFIAIATLAAISLVARRKLAAQAAGLEELVAERTTELVDTNRELLKQIDVRNRMQLRLAQAEKLEDLGLVAGGVAHDFNNLLTVILTSSELLATRLRPGSPERGRADDIAEAGKRAAEITRKLLAFSRRQILEMRTVDLAALTRETEPMLRSMLGANVELRTEIEAGPLLVRADSTQLVQVLLNLVVNARDAMPDGGEAVIRIRDVANHHGSDNWHGLGGERCVLLEVEDTGTGIAAGDLPKIFQPFFTTKEPGKGTGLGLSTVYGIIRQFDGAIRARNRGGGACFEIALPRVEDASWQDNGQETESATRLVARPEESVASRRVTGSTLVVEDEPRVRQLICDALRNRGFDVLEAPTPEDALELARRHDGRISLLVTDIVMPGMNGFDLAARIAGVGSDIAVVYISGYNPSLPPETAPLGHPTSFLQKPFRPAELIAEVDRLLARGEENERDPGD